LLEIIAVTRTLNTFAKPRLRTKELTIFLWFDSHIIETACHVLHKLPEMPVYARVDGTIINNQFLLNELELIEPALYLDRWEGATERFVNVLKSRILK